MRLEHCTLPCLLYEFLYGALGQCIFPGILADIWSEEKFLLKKQCPKKRNFGPQADMLSNMFESWRTSSEDRQPSIVKLLRAALPTLRPLTAWAVRDRHLKWISAPSAALRKC
jgi:hypothetical protein